MSNYKQKFATGVMLQMLKILVSKSTINDITIIIKSLWDENLTSNKKKAIAMRNLKDLAGDMSGWLVNITIEIVVSYLKVRTK